VTHKYVINNNLIEQINASNYPGSSVACQNEKGVTVKVPKFLQVTGIINSTLKPSQI